MISSRSSINLARDKSSEGQFLLPQECNLFHCWTCPWPNCNPVLERAHDHCLWNTHIWVYMGLSQIKNIFSAELSSIWACDPWRTSKVCSGFPPRFLSGMKKLWNISHNVLKGFILCRTRHTKFTFSWQRQAEPQGSYTKSNLFSPLKNLCAVAVLPEQISDWLHHWGFTFCPLEKGRKKEKGC